MGEIRILSEAQLRQVVSLDLGAVDCVEQGFTALARGEVSMPPILSLAIPENNGEVDVKTAYVKGLDSFAIKVSPGFFDNPKIGLPSTSGLMMLFSSRTGVLEALLLDNGYLTDVRTAAAGAVVARHLAPEGANSVGILGAGVQAQLQLQAVCLVRPIKQAFVWARDFAKAEAAAVEMTAMSGVEVRAVKEAAEAVRPADIVVTTTPAAEPILRAEWLRPGQHVTAMGSDQEHKNELEPACIELADVYVADRLAQTRLLGELRSAVKAGVAAPDEEFPELGAVAIGSATGRTSDDQITICDLTGTGVQDTMIATYAASAAAGLGLGTRFDNQE